MAFSLGKRIADLRRARGLTAEQLGKLVGVSSFAISKWENGHTVPRMRLIPKIARALGVRVEELWTLETRKERKR